MKAKIFAKLKQEFSALGLGDEYLMSKAESLAATGLVTDDNIDAVVACQRKELEGLQKANDKRVTDALEKERKKHEEETRKKAEEEAEAKRKAEEEANKKQNPSTETPSTGDPRFDELKKTLDAIIEQNKASEKKHAETIKALTDSKAILEGQVKTLSDENAAAKANAAKAARNAMIQAKAKELGVPDWRIEEGFNLAEDASDEAITDTLTKVANNISTNLLPGSKSIFPIGKNEPTKEEMASLAASLVK